RPASTPTPPPVPPTPVPTQPPFNQPTINFTLVDGCNDGLGFYVRFWNETTGQAYPNTGQVYVMNVGQTVTQAITANPGDKICIGAETNPPNNLHWGVGVDNTFGCDDCCYFVPSSGGPISVTRTFTCGGFMTAGAGRSVPR